MKLLARIKNAIVPSRDITSVSLDDILSDLTWDVTIEAYSGMSPDGPTPAQEAHQSGLYVTLGAAVWHRFGLTRKDYCPYEVEDYITDLIDGIRSGVFVEGEN